MLCPLLGNLGPLAFMVKRGYDVSAQNLYHFWAIRQAGAEAKLHPNSDGSGTITDNAEVRYYDSFGTGIKAMASFASEGGGGGIYRQANKDILFSGGTGRTCRTLTADAWTGAETHVGFIYCTGGPNGGGTVFGNSFNKAQLALDGGGPLIFNGNGNFHHVSPDFTYPVFVQWFSGGLTRVYSGSTLAQIGGDITDAGDQVIEAYYRVGNFEAGFTNANMAVDAFGIRLGSGWTLSDMQDMSNYLQALRAS